jgi:Zn-dependent protease with chaperone function
MTKECLLEQLGYLLIGIQNSTTRVIMIITAFLAPISGILITVGIAIFADTILGIWKAKKLGVKVTSRRLSAIASKMFLYQATVILFFLVDWFILNDIILTFFSVPLMLTKIVAVTLISIEVFSMDESWTAVKGKSLFTSFKELVARAKDIKEDIDPLK